MPRVRRWAPAWLRHSDPVTYPLHLDVVGRRVLVVGAGPVAVRRVQGLLAAGALVEVVAFDVDEQMPPVPLQRRAFSEGDLDGAWLVHACTGVVDGEVAALCEQRGIWCARADDATLSRAWVPAVARVDDVVISVTAGRDPRRGVALRDAVALAVDSGQLPLRRRRSGPGSVALVGGGPGDPGLLTVRGRQLLAAADVVVRDRLAPTVELPADVEVIDVGKQPGGASYDQRAIEHLLVARARAGQRVVRLKGGDVHLFARGIEEVAACRDAGLPVEVVPGVSSAFAAPAAAGIAVTARGVTQSVTVVSAHLSPEDPGSTIDWPALARLGGTIVLLMAVGRLPAVCASLLAGGLSPDTPLAVVRDATLPSQHVQVATVGTARGLDVRAPSVVVIGDVVDARR